jgi:hypothetical protein
MRCHLILPPPPPILRHRDSRSPTLSRAMGAHYELLTFRGRSKLTSGGRAEIPCWPITAPRYLPVTESSVTLPPEPRQCIMIGLRPLCPACQTRTKLARITPGPLGFDIRTFECPACDHVHQTVVELIDPMKSLKTNAWLRGQLQAPT